MNRTRKIAILTTGRQDYGILRSTLFRLQEDSEFRPLVWAGGMHLRARFGRSVELIHDDGVEISQELDFLGEPPVPHSDTARALERVSEAIERDRPESLLLLGDRTETLAAGIAATIAAVPIIHVQGGEESEGAIDNAFRHALTKLSHLHLVRHEIHRRRVIQMGESPSDVIVIGVPGADNLYRPDLPGRAQLEDELSCALASPLVVVTMHPATLGDDPLTEVSAVARAMEQCPATYVVTQPNSDNGGDVIRDYWNRWSEGRENVALVDVLGERRYWGLLLISDVVLGNSSSGIMEAPEAGVPVLNIGDRQKGRLRGEGVVDIGPEPHRISGVLRRMLTGGRGQGRVKPGFEYPNCPASSRIVEAIKGWSPDIRPRKRFLSLS